MRKTEHLMKSSWLLFTIVVYLFACTQARCGNRANGPRYAVFGLIVRINWLRMRIHRKRIAIKTDLVLLHILIRMIRRLMMIRITRLLMMKIKLKMMFKLKLRAKSSEIE